VTALVYDFKIFAIPYRLLWWFLHGGFPFFSELDSPWTLYAFVVWKRAAWHSFKLLLNIFKILLQCYLHGKQFDSPWWSFTPNFSISDFRRQTLMTTKALWDLRSSALSIRWCQRGAISICWCSPTATIKTTWIQMTSNASLRLNKRWGVVGRSNPQAKKKKNASGIVKHCDKLNENTMWPFHANVTFIDFFSTFWKDCPHTPSNPSLLWC